MAFGGDSSKVEITGGPLSYYLEYTTTNLYVESVFGANLHTIKLANDSTADTEIVSVSFDGATLNGTLKAGESITLNTKSRPGIYIKGTAGGDKVRIYGW
jgi:hypothetical protein